MAKKIILVTGGAGHIGSHVIEQLLLNPNHQIISLDNYSNGTDKNHLPGADYRFGHTKHIHTLIPESPDIVYHLGEYARIAPSFTEPDKVFDFNLTGTAAVADFCRIRGSKLVYAASSTKFATQGQEKNKNPYSFSKAVNADLINNYGDWYHLPYAICYFFNGFGPRENGQGKYATLIAKFEQIYLNRGKLTVVKPGTQRRNFTHASDLARGIILAGENGHGDGYCLGNQKSFSIIEIAKAFGGPIEYIDGYPGRDESGVTPDKARQELGWETTIDVLDYIKDFVHSHPR